MVLHTVRVFTRTRPLATANRVTPAFGSADRQAKSATSFFQDVSNAHWCATLPLALIGGFHESEYPDRLFRWDRRDSGLKELHHLVQKRMVAIVSAHGRLTFLAPG